MGLIFYAIAPSLYSAKTRIVLRAKGLEWEEHHPPDGYENADFRAMFPAGTMPSIDDNGFKLSDSEAINEYLNETHPYPPLLPDGIRARAMVRQLSRFHDTRLEPALRGLFGHVDPDARDANHVTQQAALINRRIGQLSRLIKPSPLLAGKDLTLADCGYPITFAFLERVADALSIDIGWPGNVAAYRTALGEHPVIAEELESYLPEVDAWIKSVTS